MKILAIDFGEKRLGLAVGSHLTRIATPLPQYQRINAKSDAKYMQTIIKEFEIEKIVIGYPLRMDGSSGTMVSKVEQFIAFLRKHTSLPIDLADERLSSFTADEMLKSREMSQSKRKRVLDSVAAQVILQSYLDR